MWLLTVNVWWGARVAPHATEYSQITERVECRYFRGPLNDGLRLMADYVRRANARYPTSAVDYYRLLSISQIPDDTDPESLNDLGAHELSEQAIQAMEEV